MRSFVPVTSATKTPQKGPPISGPFFGDQLHRKRPLKPGLMSLEERGSLLTQPTLFTARSSFALKKSRDWKANMLGEFRGLPTSSNN